MSQLPAIVLLAAGMPCAAADQPNIVFILAAVEPERVRAMRAKLAAWRAETGAYVPPPL